MIESYFHIKKKEEMDYLISNIFCQSLNFITRKQVLFYILNPELIWGFGLFSRIGLIGCFIQTPWKWARCWMEKNRRNIMEYAQVDCK